MREAMDLITDRVSCITFEPALPGSVNFVTIINGADCSSNLGMKGGEQHIFLNSGCFDDGLVTPVHELLHTLGFVHEHTRPDRDNFVEVHEAHRGLKRFSSKNFLNALIFCMSPNVSMAKANYIRPKMAQITIFMTVIVPTDKMDPYRLKLAPRNRNRNMTAAKKAQSVRTP